MMHSVSQKPSYIQEWELIESSLHGGDTFVAWRKRNVNSGVLTTYVGTFFAPIHPDVLRSYRNPLAWHNIDLTTNIYHFLVTKENIFSSWSMAHHSDFVSWIVYSD